MWGRRTARRTRISWRSSSSPGATRRESRSSRCCSRLALDEAPTFTKIPVLPISHRDAQPLLAALGGPVAPAAWRGALPLTYHLGPGPAEVRLKLEFDWGQATAYDVIATLPGAEHPDQWILREKAVVYINTDGNSRGFLRMGGSHTLEALMNQVAAEVEDPQTHVSVADRCGRRPKSRSRSPRRCSEVSPPRSSGPPISPPVIGCRLMG